MITFGPNDDLNAVKFSYDDAVLDKHITGVCDAILTKLINNANQVVLVLKNPDGPQMVLPGQPSPNLNFTLPNNIVLTKQ